MTKIEKLLSQYSHNEKTCIHDGRFFCTQVSCQQQDTGSIYVFACEHHCGYYLNFDPAVYPQGVAYHKDPGLREDRQEWKTMAPFAQERLKLKRD